MKVTVKKVDALRRELIIEVPKDRVSKKTDEVLAEIVKHAKIPGFRQGKAPKNMVVAAHGHTAREEMIKALVPEAYQEGVIAEKLDPIDLPSIDQVAVKDGVLSFRATLDLRPEVEIKEYKGIKLVKKSAEVSEEELAKTIEFFKKGRGMDENAPVDDTLAKSVGYPTLDEFKVALKRNMEFDKERQNRADLENLLVDELFKRGKLDVPRSLVERQLHGRVEEFSRRLKSYGAKDADIAKKLEESRKEIESAAEKDVKVFLILQKIAVLETITAAPGENLTGKVMEFLMKEAKWEETK